MWITWNTVWNLLRYLNRVHIHIDASISLKLHLSFLSRSMSGYVMLQQLGAEWVGAVEGRGVLLPISLPRWHPAPLSAFLFALYQDPNATSSFRSWLGCGDGGNHLQQAAAGCAFLRLTWFFDLFFLCPILQSWEPCQKVRLLDWEMNISAETQVSRIYLFFIRGLCALPATFPSRRFAVARLKPVGRALDLSCVAQPFYMAFRLVEERRKLSVCQAVLEVWGCWWAVRHLSKHTGEKTQNFQAFGSCRW